MPKKRRERAKANPKQPKLPCCAGCLALMLLVGSLGGMAVIGLLAMESSGSPPWRLPADLRKKIGTIDGSVLALYGFATAVGLIVACGLFARRKWAWVLYVLMTVIHVGFNVYQWIDHSDQASIGATVFELVILGYMLLPGVRNCFQ